MEGVARYVLAKVNENLGRWACHRRHVLFEKLVGANDSWSENSPPLDWHAVTTADGALQLASPQ